MQVALIHAHGGPDVLELEEHDTPVPAPDEALVRVLAVSVNHLDLWVRRGLPGMPVAFPRILGCDGTGEVIALGDEVKDCGLAIGQKVVIEPGFSSGASSWDRAGLDHLSDDYGIRGEHSDGLDAEFVTLEPRFLTPLPAGLDPVEAAAMPLAFLTAWGMLVTRVDLEKGEQVLVVAGTSGVGSAAIQLAKVIGARVIATAGSEAKRELCRELGADEVVDHYAPDWGKRVKQLTEGRGVDVVIEHVGPATWAEATRAMARNGRLVTCGGTTGSLVEVNLPHLFIKNLSLLGSTMGPRESFQDIFQLAVEGALRPVVDRVLPMSQIRAAHTALEQGSVLGKIVLIPGA